MLHSFTVCAFNSIFSARISPMFSFPTLSSLLNATQARLGSWWCWPSFIVVLGPKSRLMYKYLRDPVSGVSVVVTILTHDQTHSMHVLQFPDVLQATFVNQHQISSVSTGVNHWEDVAYVSASGYCLNLCWERTPIPGCHYKLCRHTSCSMHGEDADATDEGIVVRMGVLLQDARMHTHTTQAGTHTICHISTE